MTCLWLCGTACSPEVEGEAVSVATQRAIHPTYRALDLALNGPGWFQLTRGTDTRYSRNGQFTIDEGGWLVNQSGWRVSVFGAQARPTGLQLGHTVLSPAATRLVMLRGNLAADAPSPEGSEFDLHNPAPTFNTKSEGLIYDALGVPHVLGVYFRKSAPGVWGFFAVVEGEVWAHGVLKFDTAGDLVDVTQESRAIGHPLSFDFGDPTVAGGTGVQGITQFGGTMGASTITPFWQDGNSAATMESASVDNKGEVWVTFTDGNAMVVGQIALALFSRPVGLVPDCDHLLEASALSGEPSLDVAIQGGRGVVVAGTLEDLLPDKACEPR